MAMAVVCTALIWSPLGDEGELGRILHLEGQGMVNPLTRMVWCALSTSMTSA